MLDAIHAQIGNSEGAALGKSRMFALKKKQVMLFYIHNTFYIILAIYTYIVYFISLWSERLTKKNINKNILQGCFKLI